MVGSSKDKRTDKEIIDHLKKIFGRGWFLCRDSKIHKKKLEDLVEKGKLGRSRQPFSHIIHYKVL
jgi:hypothetical protein